MVRILTAAVVAGAMVATAANVADSVQGIVLNTSREFALFVSPQPHEVATA